MEFLEACETEWLDMWEELSLHPLNNGDALCLNNGLAWEYMGSTLDHHHLRHPHHPKTDRVEYIYLERRRAAVGWA